MQLILRFNEIFYKKIGIYWQKKLQIWMSIAIYHGYG